MNKIPTIEEQKATGWRTDPQTGNYTHSFSFKIATPKLNRIMKRILSKMIIIILIML